MSDHGLTLALGSGAAKGLAHVGVLKGIEEDGLEVTAIAGTSMGSIIGALAAQGLAAREMEALFGAIDWVRLGRIMVTSVIYVKRGEGRDFLILDGAMNDLIRPSMYDAHHDIIAVQEPEPGVVLPRGNFSN